MVQPDSFSGLLGYGVSALLAGVVAWIGASWRSARAVGSKIDQLSTQLRAGQQEIDKRLDAMAVAAETQRAALAAEMALLQARHETRFQRLEIVTWGTDEREGLRHQMAVFATRADSDRQVLLVMQQQVAQLVEKVSEVRDAFLRQAQAHEATRRVGGGT